MLNHHWDICNPLFSWICGGNNRPTKMSGFTVQGVPRNWPVCRYFRDIKMNYEANVAGCDIRVEGRGDKIKQTVHVEFIVASFFLFSTNTMPTTYIVRVNWLGYSLTARFYRRLYCRQMLQSSFNVTFSYLLYFAICYIVWYCPV